MSNNAKLRSDIDFLTGSLTTIDLQIHSLVQFFEQFFVFVSDRDFRCLMKPNSLPNICYINGTCISAVSCSLTSDITTSPSKHSLLDDYTFVFVLIIFIFCFTCVPWPRLMQETPGHVCSPAGGSFPSPNTSTSSRPCSGFPASGGRRSAAPRGDPCRWDGLQLLKSKQSYSKGFIYLSSYININSRSKILLNITLKLIFDGHRMIHC